ncbi:uncharacterized protein VICG_02174 [Vittaforma corneae ATCC 50505]|uniref:Uncharacterized protein n=1 Tax=Vittaforma corneae (strain ATCC 50505) TaxID=993615 RepID=L2GJH7_VITCO|nr:uncharacterized protein VICG_02174 [Vittaforma corneae ATCC 50505]ELA40789.1 hypothetical protein VICG_02174 [Vittaforma corneae ATCC 50505]
MTIIIQKVKDFVSDKKVIEHGLLVLLADDCFTDLSTTSLSIFINRIYKLKVWNNWTNNLIQMKAAICFVVGDEFQAQQVQSILKSNKSEAQSYFIVHKQTKIVYKNDGPCTFILKL